MQQQLFDEMIGESPASRIDIDAIVKRQQRIVTARLIGGSMAAMLALAVAGGVALTVQAEPTGSAAAKPPVQASSPVTDVRFRLVFDTPETAKATADRLSQELDQALRKHAPTASWIQDPDIGAHREGPVGQPPILAYKVGPNADPAAVFAGHKGLLNEGRKGGLSIGVGRDSWQKTGPGPNQFDWTCTDSPGCTVDKAPSGAKMKIISRRASAESQFVSDSVAIEVPGNRVLNVEVSNEFGVGDGTVAQNASPLSLEQVRAIALDIAAAIKA
jgi:hypothetical protein